MTYKKIKINGIPTIIWGEKSNKVFVAVHGNLSNKEDNVIKLLVERIAKDGYQIISFDLPEHGERKANKNYICSVQNCINDIKQIIEFAKNNYNELNLWACSMGAYFSLLSLKDEKINKCLFLSPIVNMQIVIENMMKWSKVTEKDLSKQKIIQTNFGQTLYWDYYKFVKENPIEFWKTETYILYGNKDNIQSESIINDFSKKFNCNLSILENGEHYFHTESQLEYYKNWLKNIFKK